MRPAATASRSTTTPKNNENNNTQRPKPPTHWTRPRSFRDDRPAAALGPASCAINIASFGLDLSPLLGLVRHRPIMRREGCGLRLFRSGERRGLAHRRSLHAQVRELGRARWRCLRLTRAPCRCADLRLCPVAADGTRVENVREPGCRTAPSRRPWVARRETSRAGTHEVLS
jgi:hypothetical protein